MENTEEWGPWIKHDGKGYPVPKGTVVQVIRRNGATPVIRVGFSQILPDGTILALSTPANSPQSNWLWTYRKDGTKKLNWTIGLEIIEYRVRVSKAFQKLREIVELTREPDPEETKIPEVV